LRAEQEQLARLRVEALQAFHALPDPDWYDASIWPSVDLAASTPNTTCRMAPTALPPGVICQDLLAPAIADSELVRQFLGSVVNPTASKFVALHYAKMDSGCFVYVPPYTEIQLPLVMNRASGKSTQNSFHHTLIVADKGAHVRVLQTDEPADSSLQMVVDVVEVVALEGAHVELSTWQDHGTDTCLYTLRRGLLQREASVDWIIGSFGARISKETTQSLLHGAGSQSSCLALFLGSGNQRYNLAVEMLHEGEHTTSEILTRGVLGHEARTIYVGRAAIDRKARYTSSFQRQNTLLLSEHARIDTTPELLIDVDEVQAGHATTVGQVDRDQLFYLMSRGLSRETAIRMFIHGFVEPIVQRVPGKDEQTRLIKLIDRKVAI
jgi:Fe-S cluster assembly protein SufD